RVVGCCRGAAPEGEEWPRTRLHSRPAGSAARPPPLRAPAVAVLVRATLSPKAEAEFCDACFAATGGNPLFVRELMAALATQGVAATADQAPRVREIGPEGVVRSVRLRLSRLPAEAERLARAVAVLGDDV